MGSGSLKNAQFRLSPLPSYSKMARGNVPDKSNAILNDKLENVSSGLQ